MTPEARMKTLLLPPPMTFEMIPGLFRPGRRWTLDGDCPDGRLAREVHRIGGDSPSRARGGHSSGDVHPQTDALLRLTIQGSRVAHPEGYELRVVTDRVELTGGSAAGCFYGLQTLRQLLGLFPEGVPCCVIRDAPAFALRGLLHDVTRGKVPTLETLQRLIDRLAALKCNQLQLYLEHAFVFSFDPDICDVEHGLTSDEIRELDAYARDRFITLVPAVATMGHMGRILSLPRFRRLSEIEATKTWEDMTWPERARGFTLDVVTPESMRLVERIWNEVLDAFSGPVVNICGDEPHDLGRGRNAATLDADGRARAYVRRIAETARFVQARGRRVQMWSDVLVNHLGSEPWASARSGRHTPCLLDALPRDLAILHWGYDAGARYDMTRRFVQTGFETVVCPGTTGWKRILNAISLAERNIVDFTRAGLDAGAGGLLNTDWGDHGHFNALGCSAHGIALGASCAWSGAREAGGAAFDQRFARWILGVSELAPVELLRRVAWISEGCETWTLLRAADEELTRFDLPPETTWRQGVTDAQALRRSLESIGIEVGGRATLPGADATADLVLAAGFSELLAARVLNLRYPGQERMRLSDLYDRSRSLVEAYASRWMEGCKPAGLWDILSALEKAGVYDGSLRR